MKNFGERLKEARENAGLGQYTFSKFLPIPQSSLKRWENGENIPPEYVQILLLEWLDRFDPSMPTMTERAVAQQKEKFKLEKVKFKEEIISLMKEKNVALKDLSEMLNTNRSTVQNWIYGNTAPPIYKRKRVIQILKALK